MFFPLPALVSSYVTTEFQSIITSSPWRMKLRKDLQETKYLIKILWFCSKEISETLLEMTVMCSTAFVAILNWMNNDENAGYFLNFFSEVSLKYNIILDSSIQYKWFNSYVYY